MGIYNTQNFKSVEMCHFFITGSSSDGNCQSCLEPFTNTTSHVHMKGENLYLPIIVYLYCLGICASVFINTRRINPFSVCMCSELVYVVVLTYQQFCNMVWVALCRVHYLRQTTSWMAPSPCPQRFFLPHYSSSV